MTEELWPGYRVSTASYVVSLLLPEIERDLELARFGYRVLPREPSSFTPCDDGRYLLLGRDEDANCRAIEKFSQHDAVAWPRYNRLLERIAECLEPILAASPPELLPLPKTWRRRSVAQRIRDVVRGYGLRRTLRQLGDDLPEAVEFLTGSAGKVLDRWFESDVLKATLATDAIIGAFQPVSAPGTACVLLHHVMGTAGGARGVWGYVDGGMGQLSNALAAAARAHGAEIRTDVAVRRVSVTNGRARGVECDDGERIEARQVASSVDANLTFNRFVDPESLPDGFRRAVRRIDYSSASMKINLAVSRLPDFACCPGADSAGPQHRGTIHIGASMEYLERAYDDAKYGRPSQRPIVEMTIPTAVDRTLAPAGHHIVSLFVQYAPYRLVEGAWDSLKHDFADRCLQELTRYAPGFADSVLHRQVLSPVDLERIFGLTGGNIFQGAMPLHQLFNLRPVAGWSDYRTPIDGLYLCGSAAHPGGGVMGACGRNASMEMLRDR